MSLSKNINQCRRYLPASTSRQFTCSSNTIIPPKMTTKGMSMTPVKLLNYLKHYLSNTSPDKAYQYILSKEFAQFLQKFQPSVYGSEIVKFFDITAAEPKAITSNHTISELKTEQPGHIANILTGIKLKMSGDEVPVKKEVVPKWKTQTTISTATIDSKTKHILMTIALAESAESKLRGIEDLSSHLQEFPNAKNFAVKEGALRIVLRIREQQLGDPALSGVIEEVCALLGYANPPKGHGIRILALDGGGVRGILVIEMLKKLEELTGKRVYEMFDYICGVSTGAIIGCSLGLKHITCDQLLQDYIRISTEIFTQSTIKGTSSLVWCHSYYDTLLWEKLLRQQLGDDTLISTNRTPNCPKVSTVSAIVNQEHASAYVFRNYSLPWRVRSQYMGGYKHKVWEATRASAAAPTYFEECRLGHQLHQDGGILVNNPTALAIHEAKLLWPESQIQCVVSFGTGRTVPNPIDESMKSANLTSWREKFMNILDSATDTEGIHTTLCDLLPSQTYFRFNPYLTEMLSMAEIDPKKLDQLKLDALMYVRRNEDKFQEAAKILNEGRTFTQKVKDYAKLQMEMLGLTSKL